MYFIDRVQQVLQKNKIVNPTKDNHAGSTPVGGTIIKGHSMKIFSSFVISILLILNFSKSQTIDTLKVGDMAHNF